MLKATHKFENGRIVPVENEAGAADESQEQGNDAAIDAFIDSVGLDKIKSVLRDLLVDWERGESKPEESNPDESRVRQAGIEQLGRGTNQEEESPESEESEPPEEDEPKSGPIAWRNGRRVGAVGG